MKKRLYMFILSCCLFLTSCSVSEVAIHEKDNQANYKKVFSEEVPENIDIERSAYFEYKGFNAHTPDWEFELLASEKWIKKNIDNLHLKICTKDKKRLYNYIQNRKEKLVKCKIPGKLSDYDCYYLYPTSIPYIIMFVDKRKGKDGRYKIFISKH